MNLFNIEIKILNQKYNIYLYMEMFNYESFTMYYETIRALWNEKNSCFMDADKGGKCILNCYGDNRKKERTCECVV